MARGMMRRDPIGSEIELALSQGEFIRDRACFSFVSGLEKVVTKIDALAATDPARRAGLSGAFAILAAPRSFCAASQWPCRISCKSMRTN